MTKFSILSDPDTYEIRFQDTGQFRNLKISGSYDDTWFKVTCTRSEGKKSLQYEFRLADCPVLKGLLTDLHNASLFLNPLLEQIEAALTVQLPPAQDQKTSGASTE